MFYSREEFQYQVAELETQGLQLAQAVRKVQERERLDEIEYNQLMNERDEATEFEWSEGVE
jgi:hypothetical protein